MSSAIEFGSRILLVYEKTTFRLSVITLDNIFPLIELFSEVYVQAVAGKSFEFIFFVG